MEFYKRLDLRKFYFFIIFSALTLYLFLTNPLFGAVSVLFALFFLYISLPYRIYITDFAITKKNILGISKNLILWHQVGGVEELEIDFWETTSQKIYNIVFFGWFISLLFGTKYRQLSIHDEEYAVLRFNECDFRDYEEMRKEIFARARKNVIIQEH